MKRLLYILVALAAASPAWADDVAKMSATDPAAKAAALAALAVDLPALLTTFQAAHAAMEAAKAARDAAVVAAREATLAGTPPNDAALEDIYQKEITFNTAETARSTAYRAYQEAEAAQIQALLVLKADRAAKDAPTP